MTQTQPTQKAFQKFKERMTGIRKDMIALKTSIDKRYTREIRDKVKQSLSK